MFFNPSLSNMYYEMLENFYGSIIASDSSGKILYANRYVREIKLAGLGDRIIGMQMQDLVRNGFLSKSATLEVLETQKQSIMSIEVPQLKDEDKSIMTTAIPLFDEDGKLYLVVAFSIDEFFAKEMIQHIEIEKNHLQELLAFIGKTSKTTVIAESNEMKKLLALAVRYASLDDTIIIYGESGTGKEVLSKFIYQRSSRTGKPYLSVNCAAIPLSLIESELFGYESGAFTGASSKGKAGYFELANNGTLFLDEIGELPLSAQATLLRVLENHEVMRIGGSCIIHVNVRIIAATNRNLKEMVREGKFREDLYYRLSVLELVIPPLRERPSDIKALAIFFLNYYNRKYNSQKTFALGTLKSLMTYSWPGNVRELKHTINKMVLRTPSNYLRFDLVKYNSADIQDNALTKIRIDYTQTLQESVSIFEKSYIEAILEDTHGDIQMTAERLGIHKSNLYKKISKYGIKNSSKLK